VIRAEADQTVMLECQDIQEYRALPDPRVLPEIMVLTDLREKWDREDSQEMLVFPEVVVDQ